VGQGARRPDEGRGAEALRGSREAKNDAEANKELDAAREKLS